VPTLRRPQGDDEYEIADEPAEHPAVAEAVQRLESHDDQDGPEVQRWRRSPMEWNRFRDGFGFPWMPGAVSRWIFISVMAIIPLWLAGVALALGIGGGGSAGNEVGAFAGAVAGVLAGMGAVVFGVVFAALAAIHGLTILTETSAGNDRIECWPNIWLFLDWIGNLFYVFNAAVICVALACGLGWLVPGARAAVTGLTVFFLFPLLLLCELEANSAFMPVSGLVFATLWRCGRSWLSFYVESACLLVAAGTLLALFGRNNGGYLGRYLGVILAGLLFAAVVMIYFRLLGRLGWLCSIEMEEEAGESEQARPDGP
jgi:hypothetical protein